MPTECSAALFEFARVEGRSVVGAFDGGKITSDAGALLLAATDRAVGLIDRFAGCFTDSRSPELVERTVATLVGQRIFGIALGYEDVLGHDDLRRDPMMAVLVGKLEARRKNCAPVTGKSTLNRLELGKPEPTPYHKIGHDPEAIENLLIDLFVEAHARPPRRPPPLGGQIAPFQHRRQRRGGRGGSAHCRSPPQPLAAGAHPVARRCRVCPRGADALVRAQ
jgi:DDE family transposase